MTDLGPGAHTRVRRLPTKARYDESTIFEILDLAPYCHVSALVGDLPMALPTLHYREGHTLYVHSSQSNAILRNALGADHVAVTATLYDGIRLARSGFESSIAYRSAMVVGHAYEITDLAEKYRLLSAFVDKVVPGRSAEVRRIVKWPSPWSWPSISKRGAPRSRVVRRRTAMRIWPSRSGLA